MNCKLLLPRRNAVFQMTKETTQMVRSSGKNGRKSDTMQRVYMATLRAREAEEEAKTWMNNIKEDLKTRNLNRERTR